MSEAVQKFDISDVIRTDAAGSGVAGFNEGRELAPGERWKTACHS